MSWSRFFTVDLRIRIFYILDYLSITILYSRYSNNFLLFQLAVARTNRVHSAFGLFRNKKSAVYSTYKFILYLFSIFNRYLKAWRVIGYPLKFAYNGLSDL